MHRAANDAANGVSDENAREKNERPKGNESEDANDLGAFVGQPLT